MCEPILLTKTADATGEINTHHLNQQQQVTNSV